MTQNKWKLYILRVEIMHFTVLQVVAMVLKQRTDAAKTPGAKKGEQVVFICYLLISERGT